MSYEVIEQRRDPRAKKGEWSDSLSNLLVFSSVCLALMPVMLGDRLPLIVNAFLSESSVILNQLLGFLTGLLS